MRIITTLSFCYLIFTTIILFSSCVSYTKIPNGHVTNDSNNIHSLDYSKSITEKYWKLTKIMGKPIKVSDSGEPYLILKVEGNRLTGFGSCNTFNGVFELKEQSKIVFSKIATTDIVCLDMTTENSFLKVLQTTVSYSLNGDTLTLHRIKTTPLAKFEAVYL